MSTDPGFGFCCCPDCHMFSDTFDCCWWDELCPNLGLIEDFPDGGIPCCADQTQQLLTIPTQDLGGAWKWQSASGDWWKAISEYPLYSLFEWYCNDGGLWAYQAGSLECRIGWPNDGYAFNIDIVRVNLDTAFTIEFFVPGTASSWVVTFDVTGDTGSSYNVVVRLNGGISKAFLVSKISPTVFTNRQTLYVNTNLIEGLTCIDLNTFPTGIGSLHDCVGREGWKFRIINRGGVACFDNVYWGKLRYYKGQEQPACPNCHKCYCQKTVGGVATKRLYGPWRMKVYGHCNLLLPGVSPGDFTLGPFGFFEDPNYCQLTGNRWLTNILALSCGSGTRWFRWEMNCLGDNISFKQWQYQDDEPPDPNHYENDGYWTLDGINLVIPSPADCRDLINYCSAAQLNSGFDTCFGLSCQDKYHIWEDDGTGNEPAGCP
jgi:hypothetical protein